MRRRSKILAWVVAICVALPVVAAVFVSVFDWNRARGWLDGRIGDSIGRPFEIAGDLRVDWQRPIGVDGKRAWLPSPWISAADVSIGNPAGMQDEAFATFANIDLAISVLPLLAHTVRIPSVRVSAPVLHLRRQADGHDNWSFDSSSGEARTGWTFHVGTIAFDRARITLADRKNRLDLSVLVDPLGQPIAFDDIMRQQQSDWRKEFAAKPADAAAGKSAPAKPADGSTQAKTSDDSTPAKPPDESAQTPTQRYAFGWKAHGSYNGAKLEGSGKTGGIIAMSRTRAPFPLQADVRVGASHIALVGTLTRPSDLAALDLELAIAGNSMADLYPIAGVTLPDTPPFATRGHLTGKLRRRGNVFTYDNFKGRVGASDLSGTLTWTSVAPRPKLSGKIASARLQFSDLAPLIGADPKREADVQPAGKLLPVAKFRTERWGRMDADVEYRATRILRKAELPISDLATHLVMDAGVLTLKPLGFGIAGGRLDASVRLDGRAAPMRGRLDFSARHLKLKRLFPTLQSMRTSLGEINGEGALSGTGNSIATLFGSADGEIKLAVNDGAISRELMETAGLNVANIVIGKLFGDDNVAINCAASDFVAKDGVLDTRLFVFDTEVSTIVGDGTVNLADETLDLTLRPHSKGVRVLSLRSPLHVGGTFKQPDVGVEKAALLARAGGAAALAIVAAPLAALLAMVAPSHDDENQCGPLLRRMQKAPVAPSPGKAPDSRGTQRNHSHEKD